MDRRAEHHHEDIRDTHQYGSYLNEPSNQLVRLVMLFTPRQRVAFLDDAHHQLEGEHPKSSFRQFVASFFLDDLLQSDEVDLWLSEDEKEHLIKSAGYSQVFLIPPSHLPAPVRIRTAETISGESSRGVATVLANSLLFADLTRNEELLSLLSRSLGDTVLTPEQAAAVVSAVEFNERDVMRFEHTAEFLVDETSSLPSICFSSRADKVSLLDDTDQLQWVIEHGRERRHAAVEQQRQLAHIEQLCHKYRLAQSSTGIFVPLRKHLIVANSIAEAKRLANDDRDLLLAMSPREFEEFMANVFRELGFVVDLTTATRDGGVDLICMRSLHSIPIRLAVEIKRYRDKPVTVGMVRSFLGSNEQWRANHLLYVTTSRYTKAAHEFADRFATHILTLRAFQQIEEWCEEVRDAQVSLL